MSDTVNEIHKIHVAGDAKYTYFILAAAGAAIGFAVQKTEGLKMSWWLLPVGAATLSWALSFYFGCRSVRLVQKSLAANIQMLQLKNGTHHATGSRTEVAHAMQVLLKDSIEFGSKAVNSTQAQFFFFVFGAICFIAWRIAEMIRIS